MLGDIRNLRAFMLLIAVWQRNDLGFKKKVWFKDNRKYNQGQGSNGVGEISKTL